MPMATRDKAFTVFARQAQRQLNVALTAAYDPEVGHNKATAEPWIETWLPGAMSRTRCGLKPAAARDEGHTRGDAGV